MKVDLISKSEILESEFSIEENGIIGYVVDSEVIRNAKPIDAVVVTRCENCQMWQRNRISCEGLARCITGEGGFVYRSRYDFCSKAVPIAKN